MIKIDSNTWRLGEGTSNYSNDRGFSPLSSKINIDRRGREGILSPNGTSSSAGTFSSIWPLAVAQKALYGPYVFFGATGNDLKVYTTSGSALTDTGKSDNGRDYEPGITHAIKYNGKIYVTSTTDIAYDIDAETPDYDWWTTVPGEGQAALNDVPHLLLIVSGVLLISNGNKIEYWDGTNADTILTLQDTDQIITSWCLHNDNVYFTTTNQSGSQGGNSYLHIWDGRNVNNVLIAKDIPLANECLHIQSFQGELFLFFEHFLASYNGIKFQRLKTINWADASTPDYLTAIKEDRFYFVDNPNTTSSCIIAYRDGIFYKFHSLAGIRLLFGYISSWLNFLTDSSQYYMFHYNHSSNGVWYSNWYELGGNHKITRVLVEFAEAVTDGETNTLKIYNQKLSKQESEEPDNYIELNCNYSSVKGMSNYVREFRDLNFFVSSFQVAFNTFDTSVKSITIEYERTNQPIAKY